MAGTAARTTGTDLDDLLAPNAVADPYAVFAVLRRDDPVHRNARWGGWVLTRYDDVALALTDCRFSAGRVEGWLGRGLDADERAALAPTGDLLARWMVFTDPPVHTRLRRLLAGVFTPRTVEALRPDVVRLVDELVGAFARDGGGDLLAHVARPLPGAVIARLLGVPLSDVPLLTAWSDDVLAVVFGALGEPGRHVRAAHGMGELAAYLGALLERRAPGGPDADRGDLLARLARAAAEDGDALTAEEAVATAVLLLFAGHETTTNLLANGVVALLRHPGTWAAMATAPPTGVAAAVEELLRYDGPSKAQVRVVAQDVDLGGRRLAAGDRVLAALAAANRDPARFRDPDRLDVTRAAGPGLAFGHGLHYCLGAPLARLEAQVALPALARALPSLALADEPLRWQPVLLSRALEALPVAA